MNEFRDPDGTMSICFSDMWELENLLETLYLQKLTEKLKVYYEEVGIEMFEFSDGYHPMITIYNWPVELDTVDELLLRLPREAYIAETFIDEDLLREMEYKEDFYEEIDYDQYGYQD